MTAIPLWRQIQRLNFTDWHKLICYLGFDEEEALKVVQKRSGFPLNLPLRLAEKIKKKNWQDPLLLQFLPTLEEEKPSALFVLDPVSDASFQKTPKLLHKYNGRALLVCTSACAMHCRYCFRRHYDYETSAKTFEPELAAIRADSSLTEILLSGGDPLSLSDQDLGSLLQRLGTIPHVKRIRFHTRFPMGIPERITDSFLELLASCTQQVIFVIHCNHAHELDPAIFAALKKVQMLGIPLLSQSVLLKGVNDSVETLYNLFEALINQGILPYYLHQLDRVQGAAHFEVEQAVGLQLLRELQSRLPGYAVPKYAREEPFKPHKTLINSL
jgi:EF-P beta-lysylation protein EpmB